MNAGVFSRGIMAVLYFCMSVFEIARSEFSDHDYRPYVLFPDKNSKFSTACVRVSGKAIHTRKTTHSLLSSSPVW